jgi:VWFA-related protein
VVVTTVAAPRRTGTCRLTVGVGLFLSACLAAEPQDRVFRSANRTVSVYATVQSGDRLVTDLPREAFQVLDNGRAQPISLFENRAQPISMVVMLDTSESMLGNLALVRNAAVQMFMRLLPNDRARVGTFGRRIRISDAFTSDTETLVRTLWSDMQAGGGTPLWPAVQHAMSSLGTEEGRRVVLVFSDGHDGGETGSDAAFELPVTLEEVTARAIADQFIVYGIALRSRSTVQGHGRTSPPSHPDPSLRALAAETGGGYFLLDDDRHLGTTFARVADELHRQYLIGYALPAADGGRHVVEVRVNSPALTVRARKSYVAPRSSR